MELNKGYKQTEIGVIPDEWKLMTIDQIFEFHSTSNYSKAEMLPEGEIGCFHYGLIHSLHNNNYDIRTGVKYFITKQQAKYEFIKDGDVVMVDASEDLSGVNKSIEISDVEDKLFISGLHTYLLRDRGFFEKYFRGPILNAYFTKAQFYRLAVGMKVYGVSKQQLKTVLLPIPSKSEQTAIANALSDADSYITNLEKLLEKKRQIKQGAMQELLKPKDEWELKMIGEICSIFKGKGISKNQVDVEGKHECILYGELFTKYNEVIFDVISRTNFEDSIKSKIGDILYPGSTTTTGIDLAKASTIMKDNILLGGDIVVLRRSNFNYNPVYLSFFLNQMRRNEIAQTTKGITIHHLYGKDLAGIYAAFPPIYVQDQIASTLLDMDIEITAIENKVEKFRNFKKGMAQNLLTGKIRLI